MHNLDALGAFALALATVWVATPIAGRIAWRIGAIDLPRERGLHMLPTPRLGGLALLVGIVASRPGLPGARQGDVRDPRRSGRHRPRGRGRRRARAGSRRQARRSVPRRPGARDERCPGGDADASVPRPHRARHVPPVRRDRARDRRGDEHGQLHRRRGRAGGGRLHHRGPGPRGDSPVPGPHWRRHPCLHHGAVGRWATSDTAFTRPRSSSETRARICSATCWRRSPSRGPSRPTRWSRWCSPWSILAVPILDSGFVIAKRVKYRQPVYRSDSEHFHHRFARIGFSQRRTVLYLYAWTLSLAALALALRFVPYSQDDGTLNPEWAAVVGVFFLAAFAASIYLVLVLEILKFRRFRERQLRRAVETGGDARLVRARNPGRDRARGRDRRVRGGLEQAGLHALALLRRPAGDGWRSAASCARRGAGSTAPAAPAPPWSRTRRRGRACGSGAAGRAGARPATRTTRSLTSPRRCSAMPPT